MPLRREILMLTLGAGIGLLALAAPGQAQEGDVADILARLDSQRSLWQQAEVTDLGPTRSIVPAGDETRGLRLVTAEEVGVAPMALEPDTQAASADAVTVDASAPLSVAQDNYGVFGEGLRVEVAITFGFDSATLDASQAPRLAQMCQALTASDFVVRIIGHTDSRGSTTYNDSLSLLRAEAVARHLAGCGVAVERLQIMGVGERFPVNAADPLADENRRVEFQAVG